MSAELATINYKGTDIYVQGEYVAVRQMAEAMGLDWEGQRQLIERNHWSEGHTFKAQVCLPGAQQAYNILFMHRRRVPMWVANISTGHIQDEKVKQTVIRWQNEIADVLADYYEGKLKPVALPPSEVIKEIRERARLARREQRELAKQGIIAHVNPDTWQLTILPGTVSREEFKAEMRQILVEEQRKADRNADSPYQTREEQEKGSPWQTNPGQR